jgi:hypothetical protein
MERTAARPQPARPLQRHVPRDQRVKRRAGAQLVEIDQGRFRLCDTDFDETLCGGALMMWPPPRATHLAQAPAGDVVQA